MGTKKLKGVSDFAGVANLIFSWIEFAHSFEEETTYMSFMLKIFLEPSMFCHLAVLI